MATIVQHNAVAAGDGNTTTTTYTVTMGAGASAGNVLFNATAIDKSAGSFNVPSGYATAAADYVSADVSLQTLIRTATAGNQSISPSWATAVRYGGGPLVEISGVTTTGMQTATNNSGASSVTSQGLVSAVTAAAAGIALVVVAVDSCSAWGGPSGNPTWAAGWTALTGQSTTGTPASNNGFPGWSLAYKLVVAGESVNPSASWSGGTADQAAIALIILPNTGSAPAAPSGLTATPASATQINLAWTDNASDETGYTVERSAAGAGTWSVLTSSLAAGTTSYNDTTASANTSYDYRVKATNGAGSSSYATASGARTYPGAPTGLSATAASSSQIDLSWSAPSGGATSYKIERSPTGTGSWTEIATGITATSYSSTGLSASTTYYYRVRATNATGDSGYSGNANATTSSGATVPAQVTGLSASAASSSAIDLSWSAASGATSYKVERSPDGSTGWTQIASGVVSTSYGDTGLTASTIYYYRVRATNAQGDGSYSTSASATTSAAAPPAPIVTISARPVTAAEYKLIVRSPAGVKKREIGDYDWLAYTKRVNDPGLLRFGLRGDHPALGVLAELDQVEVWRRMPAAGVDWYCDFRSIYRDEGREQAVRTSFEASCPGAMSMLGWRHVAWKANTANRSVFTGVKAATIMWRLVDYNAGPNATTGNGREVGGAISGLSVGSDPNTGSTVDWACAWAPLLAELQKLQKLAGGDFDLVKTGASTWAWQFFPGQRGTDRSATVVFSIDRGNMTNARLRATRSTARTVAIVGGPGEEAARQVRVRTVTGYSSDYHIETFVDARGNGDAATSAALDAQGDQALEVARLASQPALTYDVLQTDSCRYGLHYNVGDLVAYRAFNLSGTQQILAATVEHRGLAETIRVEQRDV